MNKLVELEEARAIMTEAIHWSVMKWLSEKKRVRRAADAANDALDTLEKQIRSKWDPQLATAYKQLTAAPEANGRGVSEDVVRLARSIRQAHDAALSMRMDAEAIFKKAEKRLSTSLAREGCQKALEGWDSHEEAIKRSERGIASGKGAA